MSNSIFNNDDITIANGVHNPMLKDLDANKKNIGDVATLSCDTLEVDETFSIAGDIELTTGNITLQSGNLAVQTGTTTLGGGMTLTGAPLDATAVDGNFDNVNAGNNVNAGSGFNGTSMNVSTSATIGTDANIGKNVNLVFQGGTPTYNSSGMYAVNNAPALETYIQSAELAGQHGVLVMRTSNGAISGNKSQITLDETQGVRIECDNGSILLDTGGVGNIDLDNNERIINCVNPIDPQDVATKDYVDTEIEDAHGTFMIDPPSILGSDGTGDFSVFYSIGINAVLDVETITYRKYEIHLNNGVGAPMTISQADSNGNAIAGNYFYYAGAYVSFITISAGELRRLTPSKQSATPSRLYYLVEKVF